MSETLVWSAKHNALLARNEIYVTHIKLTRASAGSNRVKICFNIGWNNSWRYKEGGYRGGNWDAAWVFIKLNAGKTTPQLEELFPGYVPGTWGPAHLCTRPADHAGPPEAQIMPAEDGMGVFIYRSQPGGPGPVRFDGIELTCKASTSSFVNTATEVSVSVFAYRMVYIPGGAFWIGDPQGPHGPMNTFFDPASHAKNADNQAYRVESEAAIPIGTQAADSGPRTLAYHSQGYGGDRKGPLPAEFPKGFEAFYVMRSHVSQGQYARFVNFIPVSGKTNRFPYLGEGSFRFTIFTDRAGQRIATRPRRACNFLAWADGAALACWAGLRPMTELEFAKACRGFGDPVTDEFAWGDRRIELAQIIVGQENGREIVSGNCNTSNAFTPFDGGDGGYGPVRDDGLVMAGSPDAMAVFPDQKQTFTVTAEAFKRVRQGQQREFGSSYFGVMGMSGNLWEYCVSVGLPEGRCFTGKHGTGTVTVEGDACHEELGWPGTEMVGVGFRGGSWYTDEKLCRLADRTYAAGLKDYAFRSHDTGFRCARTAPKVQD
ncbi:MAG: SUMF1/EgtB/PvdO family nonheme iron enzyme [Acidobacteriota bacterium]